MNAADQTKRRQQHDEQRREDSIRLEQLFLATYIFQSQQHTGKLDQLTRTAATLPIDIVAVQEHRMIRSLEIDTMKRNDSEFKLISATGTEQKLGGIRIFIRKIHSWSNFTSKKISDRTIKTYFAGNPMVTIVATYATTKVTTADMKENFTMIF